MPPGRNLEVPVPVVRRPARDRPETVGVQHGGPSAAHLPRVDHHTQGPAPPQPLLGVRVVELLSLSAILRENVLVFVRGKHS